MRFVWLLAGLALGCRGILGIDEPIAVIDGGPGAVGDCASWHPQGFDPCQLGEPGPALHLAAGNYVYDTTQDGGQLSQQLPDDIVRLLSTSRLTVVQSDRSVAAVLSVDALTIDAGATVRVIGGKPLLVVGWSTIEIDGAIDAGSHPGSLGAGANTSCTAGDATRSSGHDGGDVPTAAGGSGGGGGGALAAAGGPGGDGKLAGVTGGAGGAAAAASVIRGGCEGGASGAAGAIAASPSNANSRALGGGGGGAIRWVAHDAIAVAGSITVNGGGGQGAPANSACGGGGGGSGGYVAFEAPGLTISGAVTANGGGGGGGGASGSSGNEAGNAGSDGAVDILAAPGGAATASGCGQAGGAGSSRDQLTGSPGASFTTSCIATGGGGGGGGAAGFLLVASPSFQATATAKLSPPVMP